MKLLELIVIFFAIWHGHLSGTMPRFLIISGMVISAFMLVGAESAAASLCGCIHRFLVGGSQFTGMVIDFPFDHLYGMAAVSFLATIFRKKLRNFLQTKVSRFIIFFSYLFRF